MRKYTKILILLQVVKLLQVPHAWSCSPLFKVQPVIRSVSCACCLSPGRGSSSEIEVLATGILFQNIHSNGIWQDWCNKGAQEKTHPSFRNRKRLKKTVNTIEKRKEEAAFLRVGSVTQWVCVIWSDRVKEVAAGQHRKVQQSFCKHDTNTLGDNIPVWWHWWSENAKLQQFEEIKRYMLQIKSSKYKW